MTLTTLLSWVTKGKEARLVLPQIPLRAYSHNRLLRCDVNIGRSVSSIVAAASDSSRHQPSSESPDGKMDPVVRKDLEFILERNITEIMFKYASYTDCIRATVQGKGVTVEELRYYLLHLPAVNKTHKDQNLTLLADKEVELEKCNTIIEIFTFLTKKCASFLNYEIFHGILMNYDIPEDQEKLKYPEHLKAFIEKHKISEFVKINPQLKPKNGSKELILKCDIENTCRLAKITDLKKSISKIFGLLPSALEIIDIEDGCVVVTFSIPASVADAIFTSNTVLLPHQEDELRNASVRWLKCNGYTFHFGKEELIKNAGR